MYHAEFGKYAKSYKDSLHTDENMGPRGLHSWPWHTFLYKKKIGKFRVMSCCEFETDFMKLCIFTKPGMINRFPEMVVLNAKNCR